MIEYKIKSILKCNKADPDGIPLPKGGGRVVVSHTTLNNISAILCHSILLVEENGVVGRKITGLSYKK
jgi:hypothetical protein